MGAEVGMASGFEEMQAARRVRWHQTGADRIAARLIEAAGVATLYPVSPEIPNLFHAYTGDPAAKTDSGHSSPSGEVYGWRWALGRREAAFYSVLVRGRPTWMGWSILPAVLCLCGETRSVDDTVRGRGNLGRGPADRAGAGGRGRCAEHRGAATPGQLPNREAAARGLPQGSG